MTKQFAYIILAHREPKQLAQLIQVLQHEDDHFFVHIDSKVSLEPFHAEIGKLRIPNIHFVNKRENGQWGGFGIVQATLNAIEEIILSKINFCHVHLLSGQDYPIKKQNEIRDFFLANVGKDFIEYEAFPVKHLDGGGWHRLKHYSWTIGGKRYTFLPKDCNPSFNFKGKLLNGLLWSVELILPKRQIPYALKAYYGSQWWSLSGKTVGDLVKFIKRNPEYIKFHERSLLPDEMFFQTLVMYFYHEEKPVNDNKRFILWEEGSSHPVELNENQKQLLIESDKYFARKFSNTDFLNT